MVDTKTRKHKRRRKYVKKEQKLKQDYIRQFDDLDNELIATLIRSYSKILGINKPVSLVDKEQMASLFYFHMNKKEREKNVKELDYIFGSTYPDDRVVYLNPRLCKRNYQSLVDTLIHELLHIKHPEKTEEQILELERQYSGRFDYNIKKTDDLKKEGLTQNCKVIRF